MHKERVVDFFNLTDTLAIYHSFFWCSGWLLMNLLVVDVVGGFS